MVETWKPLINISELRAQLFWLIGVNANQLIDSPNSSNYLAVSSQNMRSRDLKGVRLFHCLCALVTGVTLIFCIISLPNWHTSPIPRTSLFSTYQHKLDVDCYLSSSKWCKTGCASYDKSVGKTHHHNLNDQRRWWEALFNYHNRPLLWVQTCISHKFPFRKKSFWSPVSSMDTKLAINSESSPSTSLRGDIGYEKSGSIPTDEELTSDENPSTSNIEDS